MTESTVIQAFWTELSLTMINCATFLTHDQNVRPCTGSYPHHLRRLQEKAGRNAFNNFMTTNKHMSQWRKMLQRQCAIKPAMMMGMFTWIKLFNSTFIIIIIFPAITFSWPITDIKKQIFPSFQRFLRGFSFGLTFLTLVSIINNSVPPLLCPP
jgi:hypothetical protein